MAEVFGMGGFGSYIWTSYGIAALCLGWLTYSSWHKERNAAKLLANLKEKQPNNDA